MGTRAGRKDQPPPAHPAPSWASRRYSSSSISSSGTFGKASSIATYLLRSKERSSFKTSNSSHIKTTERSRHASLAGMPDATRRSNVFFASGGSPVRIWASRTSRRTARTRFASGSGIAPPSATEIRNRRAGSGRLHRHVDESRQPALAGDTLGDVEKFLLALEGHDTLDPAQVLRARRPRRAPAAGDLGHVLGHILASQELQAGGVDQTLVLAGRSEQEIADRAAHGDLLIGERPGHDDRIGEQEPAAGFEHPGPFGQNVDPVRQVVDRVDADQRVERTRLEGKRLAGIDAIEPGALGQPVHPRLLPRDGDGLVLDIDAEDLAAGETRDAQRRPSRAAGDVDEARPRRGIQPAEERLELVGREPGVLTQVLAEGGAADLAVEGAGEVAVAGPVMIDPFTPTIIGAVDLAHAPVCTGRAPDINAVLFGRSSARRRYRPHRHATPALAATPSNLASLSKDARLMWVSIFLHRASTKNRVFPLPTSSPAWP